MIYPEISRVLSPGGVFVGTLPGYEWGKALRKIRGYQFEEVRFVKISGGYVTLNSFLMGDLTIKRELMLANMETIMLANLFLPQNIERISPDIVEPANLLGLDPKSLPIVKLIVARRN
jgi:hypothetical protein